MLSTAPRPGRPRDPRIDEVVLRATADLVVEVGYGDLTIAAVADRAGTTKPAIYRRWPSKAHLVHEAVFPSTGDGLVPETADLEADIRAMVRGAVELFSRPAVRAALPGLLAALTSDPALHAALLERFEAGVWGRMQGRIRRAVQAGEVRPDVDPGALIDVLAGAALLALTIRTADQLDDRWVDATVALIMKGISP